MNTVLALQPEDVALLLANNVERQELQVRLREIQARLDALDQQDNEILTGTVRIDEGHNEEPEAMPDFSIFKDTTCRLLEAMWEAPDRMMSQEDIREYVIFDEYASENAVKQVIKKAKKEIGEYEIEIKNIWGKGYKLITDK